jgi:hypothetical protein
MGIGTLESGGDWGAERMWISRHNGSNYADLGGVHCVQQELGW